MGGNITRILLPKKKDFGKDVIIAFSLVKARLAYFREKIKIKSSL